MFFKQWLKTEIGYQICKRTKFTPHKISLLILNNTFTGMEEIYAAIDNHGFYQHSERGERKGCIQKHACTSAFMSETSSGSI